MHIAHSHIYKSKIHTANKSQKFEDQIRTFDTNSQHKYNTTIRKSLKRDGKNVKKSYDRIY